MTGLPPAGWFPDPESGGTRWRWWDGYQWAPSGYGYPGFGYDQAAFARSLQSHAETTRRTGRWLRWTMAANAFTTLLALAAFAWAFHGGGIHLLTTDADGTVHFSRSLVAVQLASLPLNVVPMAYFVLLIAWIYNAGKFADSQRWPAARGRTLGAFSVLIPVVNFWWPYEAIRDLYPPGGRPTLLLHWWLSFLIVPFASAVTVLIATFAGPVWLWWAGLSLAAGLSAMPVVLGWRLVDDLDAMQRAHS